MRIVGNKIKCRNCGDILQSMHRHDFQSCTCRRISDTLTQQFITILNDMIAAGSTLNTHLAACAFEKVVGTGISVDGGSDYTAISGNLDNVEYI